MLLLLFLPFLLLLTTFPSMSHGSRKNNNPIHEIMQGMREAQPTLPHAQPTGRVRPSDRLAGSQPTGRVKPSDRLASSSAAGLTRPSQKLAAASSPSFAAFAGSSSQSSSRHRPSERLQHQQSFSSGHVCSCKRGESLASMVPLLGDVRKGKYLFNPREINSGTQGTLYHGYSIHDRTCVAVKITYLGGDDPWIDECMSEVEIMTAMSRIPNLDRIIRLYDSHYNQQTKIMTVIMELADEDMEEYWNKFAVPTNANYLNEATRVDMIRGLFKELLEAFVQLHAIAKVIHLDFKLANAMFKRARNAPPNQRGVLKLIDFGGAQRAGQDLVIRTILPDTNVGTREYISPEQHIKFYYKFLGRTEPWVVSIKADIWAIGSVILQLVTGFSADYYFYKKPENYILDYSENYDVIYDRMGQELYPDIVRLTTPLNAPLMHMAMACLHADPRVRPTAMELLGYMNGQYRLSVSSQYYVDPDVMESAKTYSEVLQDANSKCQQRRAVGLMHQRKRTLAFQRTMGNAGGSFGRRH